MEDNFIEAIEGWDINKVKKTIKDWIDINLQYEYWYTALMTATNISNIEITRFLLNNWADPYIETVFGWINTINIASKNWNIEIIKLLLEKWVNINFQNSLWQICLMSAIWSDLWKKINVNRINIIKFLLDNWANPNIQDIYIEELHWYGLLIYWI